MLLRSKTHDKHDQPTTARVNGHRPVRARSRLFFPPGKGTSNEHVHLARERNCLGHDFVGHRRPTGLGSSGNAGQPGNSGDASDAGGSIGRNGGDARNSGDTGRPGDAGGEIVNRPIVAGRDDNGDRQAREDIEKETALE